MTIIHTTPTPIPLPRTPSQTPRTHQPLTRRPRATRPPGPPGALADRGAGVAGGLSDQMNGEHA